MHSCRVVDDMLQTRNKSYEKILETIKIINRET
jgi:hypothetical protein